MAIDNDLSLVEERLISALVAALPTGVSSAFFKGPNGAFEGGKTPNNEPWCRAGLTSVNSPIDTDASGCYEINQGLFNVGLFWPKGTGSRQALQAAHEVKELYDANEFDDLKVIESNISPAPEEENSLWYGVNINITYQYEGLRS